jgi:hypothetical protein
MHIKYIVIAQHFSMWDQQKAARASVELTVVSGGPKQARLPQLGSAHALPITHIIPCSTCETQRIGFLSYAYPYDAFIVQAGCLQCRLLAFGLGWRIGLSGVIRTFMNTHHITTNPHNTPSKDFFTKDCLEVQPQYAVSRQM